MAVPTPDKMKPLQANTNELSLPIMFCPEASKLLLVNALETMVRESIGETFSTTIVNKKLISIIENNNIMVIPNPLFSLYSTNLRYYTLMKYKYPIIWIKSNKITILSANNIPVMEPNGINRNNINLSFRESLSMLRARYREITISKTYI